MFPAVFFCGGGRQCLTAFDMTARQIAGAKKEAKNNATIN
jgi:hypothetical protein